VPTVDTPNSVAIVTGCQPGYWPHNRHPPEEIAEWVAFLVSPGARWMTGMTLRMDAAK
jgi:NAD(P)-dependent dehydrogenase (short-subunit alcohol dehydrogenase family)